VFRGLPQSYWIVWAATLIDRLGGFAYAFLTLYLTGERQLSVEEASAILALAGLGGLAGSLLGGVLADHLGRKVTLSAGLLASSLLMGALAFARAPWAIAAAWLLYGLAGGVSRPASQALVADLVPEPDRLRAYGLLHWAVNIGFAVAPAVGGFLARRTFTGLFLVDGATTMVTALVVLAFVPGGPPPAQHESALRGLGRVFRDGPFVGFLLCMVGVAVVYAQAESSLPIDMIAKGATPETYGLVISVNGALIMLLSPALTGALARAEPMRVLAAAAVLTGVGFGLDAVVSTGPLYALTVVVWTIAEILATPASGAVVARRAPPEQWGRYNGAYAMSWSLARFLGPPAGGLVMAHLGAGTLWLACLGVGLGAGLALFGLSRRVKA
jgi:MFS family permease